MPESRIFRGQKVKRAKRLVIAGREIVRITFEGRKGEPGKQTEVSLSEYNREIRRSFKPGTHASVAS